MQNLYNFIKNRPYWHYFSMDGVFMKKLFKLTICLALILAILGFVDLWRDKQTLKEDILRLHVVGNSDSAQDQQVKLQVKDAIVAYLQPIMDTFPTKKEAMEYIQNNLHTLQELSNRVLESLGVKERAKVALQPICFDTRDYDTFSLPAGVYDALRVEIGEAEGKNWWCVVFPSLCLPATSADFRDTAVSSGFSQNLTDTLSGNGYNLRFYLLDCIGKLENLFY